MLQVNWNWDLKVIGRDWIRTGSKQNYLQIFQENFDYIKLYVKCLKQLIEIFVILSIISNKVRDILQ
jgi:hypothetical protein